MVSFPGLQDYFEDEDVLFNADPWAILSTEKLAGYMLQECVVGHKCVQFEIVQFLDEEDVLRGQCWWCKEVIPEEIQGLWKMYNWENLPKMRTYTTDEDADNIRPSGGAYKKATLVKCYVDKPIVKAKSTTNVTIRSKTITSTHKDGQYPDSKKYTQVGLATTFVQKQPKPAVRQTNKERSRTWGPISKGFEKDDS